MGLCWNLLLAWWLGIYTWVNVQSNHKMLWVMAILFSSTLFALELETMFLRGNGRPGFLLVLSCYCFRWLGMSIDWYAHPIFATHARCNIILILFSAYKGHVYRSKDNLQPNRWTICWCHGIHIVYCIDSYIYILMYALVEKRLCSFIRSLIFKRESLESKKTAE